MFFSSFFFSFYSHTLLNCYLFWGFLSFCNRPQSHQLNLFLRLQLWNYLQGWLYCFLQIFSASILDSILLFSFNGVHIFYFGNIFKRLDNRTGGQNLNCGCITANIKILQSAFKELKSIQSYFSLFPGVFRVIQDNFLEHKLALQIWVFLECEEFVQNNVRMCE